MSQPGGPSRHPDMSDTRAFAGSAAVVNLLTRIRPLARMLLPGAWRENERLRREASRAVAVAAGQVGAERLVQESFASLYADGGARWLDEHAPLDPAGPPASALLAERNAREACVDLGGLPALLVELPDGERSLLAFTVGAGRISRGGRARAQARARDGPAQALRHLAPRLGASGRPADARRSVGGPPGRPYGRSTTSQPRITSRESLTTRSRPGPQSMMSRLPPTERTVSFPAPPKIRSTP